MLRSLLKSAGLVVALAVLSCLMVEAQITCSQLKAVKIWKGSYDLRGVGSGSFQGESITVNHSMTSSFTLSGPTGNCSGLVWTGAGSSSSGSLNDTATFGPETQTLVGARSNLVPPPQLTLTIDATSGTYTFSGGFGVLSTLTECAAGMCLPPVTEDFAGEPLKPAAWPQPPYHLPSSGLVLSGTATFSGQPVEWLISVPWTQTWDIRANCEPPTGETTAWVGWAGPVGTFKQTLTSSDGFTFDGLMVKETDAAPGTDSCWFPGSAFAPSKGVTGDTWKVESDNSWFPDGVGFKSAAVLYYRQHKRAPCGATAFQQMELVCSDGSTHKYGKVNILRGVIGSKIVQSSRAGVTKWENWP